MPNQSAGHDGPNAAQAEYWNGPSAAWWVSEQERVDRQFAPLTEALIAQAAPAPGESVVDVGCGCGATTLALADRVGEQGRVLGIDLAASMVARANHRAETAGLPQVRVVTGDATLYPFMAEADLMVSRLGVMFFVDPAGALAHLRTALRPGGRLVFVCWRTLAENPWFIVPLDAARHLLPPAEPPVPDAPGPFAFAEAGRIRSLLTGAGWQAVRIAPLDVGIAMGPSAEAGMGAINMGPLARLLADAPEAVRTEARSVVTSALAAYDGANGVELPAALWLVSATA